MALLMLFTPTVAQAFDPLNTNPLALGSHHGSISVGGRTQPMDTVPYSDHEMCLSTQRVYQNRTCCPNDSTLVSKAVWAGLVCKYVPDWNTPLHHNDVKAMITPVMYKFDSDGLTYDVRFSVLNDLSSADGLSSQWRLMESIAGTMIWTKYPVYQTTEVNRLHGKRLEDKLRVQGIPGMRQFRTLHILCTTA